MTATLWQIELSHYNEKARWALDYKRIPHSRRAPIPGAHGPVALVLTRGKHRRLPILDLNGRRIGDSSAIIAALETYQPDPPLYPDDAHERERALALEDLFDEELGPQVRRLVWHHTISDRDATVDALMTSASPRKRKLMRAIVPLARPAVKLDYGVSAGGADEAVAEIRRVMDRVEAELQPSGYLVGDRFSVADLAGAALFTTLLCPPGRQYAPPTFPQPLAALRSELAVRPGGAWVAEMYARHRGVSAEIPK